MASFILLGAHLYTSYPIVARALGLAAARMQDTFARASKGILHTKCSYA